MLNCPCCNLPPKRKHSIVSSFVFECQASSPSLFASGKELNEAKTNWINQVIAYRQMIAAEELTEGFRVLCNDGQFMDVYVKNMR